MQDLGVVETVRQAFAIRGRDKSGRGHWRPNNLIALALSTLIAFAPISAFVTKLCMPDLLPLLDDSRSLQVSQAVLIAGCLAIVIGGFTVSAKTVWEWMAAATGSKIKATGYIFVVEGALMWGPVVELSYVALAFVVSINMIATTTKYVHQNKRARASRAKPRSVRRLKAVGQ